MAPSKESIKNALEASEKSGKVLGLNVGKHESVSPGTYIPKADAQSAPELSLSEASATTTYLMVALDIDAPFPSCAVLGPILHWIQPGLTMEQGSPTLKAETPFVANFIGPAPPPGSSPHRYVFMLYEQPASFDGAKYAPPNGQNLPNTRRMRYNLDSWAKEIGLGPLVAANYFKSN